MLVVELARTLWKQVLGRAELPPLSPLSLPVVVQQANVMTPPPVGAV